MENFFDVLDLVVSVVTAGAVVATMASPFFMIAACGRCLGWW